MTMIDSGFQPFNSPPLSVQSPESSDFVVTDLGDSFPAEPTTSGEETTRSVLLKSDVVYLVVQQTASVPRVGTHLQRGCKRRKKNTEQIYFQRTKYFFILLSAMHQFQLVMHCCCGRCSRSFTLVLLLLLRGLIISGLESFLVICQLRNFENYKGRKLRKFENCQRKT